MAHVTPPPDNYPVSVETVIVGSGACGMVAALSAAETGQDVLVLERDPVPSGSTALSAGLIPAAGTRFQIEAGIADDPELFAEDIQRKANDENDSSFVSLLTDGAAETVEWLADRHGIAFSLVDGFDYPGHSRRRMHGLPSRSGRELVDQLRRACETSGIDILCNAVVTTLHAEGRGITGITAMRPDGTRENIGCDKLILACNGFGGNRTRVARHMPEIEAALWFGHDGNRGEALDWGEALGAATQHLGAFQGHGNVAHPHGILITWAVITGGGIQVNRAGKRFWNEAQGYSEAARAVLAQPEGIAFAIFDERIAATARQFADFRAAEAQGAIRSADMLEDLAADLGVPFAALEETVSVWSSGEQDDAFGRPVCTRALEPPYCGVRVTGALFHTQGGLVVDANARVLHRDGQPFENLFAAGGAACGVSGSGDAGYLSGNGLLSAVVLGRIAGRSAPTRRGA